MAADAHAARGTCRHTVEAEVDGGTRVLNLIQVFERIGLDNLKAAVKTPLKDLKPACYYGCLLMRPPEVVEFDDCEQPRSMEAWWPRWAPSRWIGTTKPSAAAPA